MLKKSILTAWLVPLRYKLSKPQTLRSEQLAVPFTGLYPTSSGIRPGVYAGW
jgi:hypothetical protein